MEAEDVAYNYVKSVALGQLHPAAAQLVGHLAQGVEGLLTAQGQWVGGLGLVCGAGHGFQHLHLLLGDEGVLLGVGQILVDVQLVLPALDGVLELVALTLAAGALDVVPDVRKMLRWCSSPA